MNSRKIFGFLSLLLIFLLPACEKKLDTNSDVFDVQRRNMVRWDLKAENIKSERVMNAMLAVPRHLFIPERYRKDAYKDVDLPISQFSQGLTTPRPVVVAKTIELLNLKGTERVLEVGTGRGYQSALLAELAKEVYTIEIVPEVAKEAEAILSLLSYKNIFRKLGDGYVGWPEKAPFDAILVSPSGETPPQPLLDQLVMGGRLVMPVGNPEEQKLILYRKLPEGLRKESTMTVQIKPMEGRGARPF